MTAPPRTAAGCHRRPRHRSSGRNSGHTDRGGAPARAAPGAASSHFALFSLLITLAAVSSYVNDRFIKLPTTVGVMVVALIASLVLIVAGPYAGGFREHAAALVARIDFDRVVLHGMLAFWELVDEILDVVLFLLIGLELLVVRLGWQWLLAGPFTILIVLLARWPSVAGIVGSLRVFSSQAEGAITVLTWGGLRGAISVAMALSLPAGHSRTLVLPLTSFVVVFSMLVQGLTIGRVIRMVAGPPGRTGPSTGA